MNIDMPQLQPFDEHNQRLKDNVHPADWVNPTPTRPYHLVVIGAGTAGLVTAAGAAGLGARVALVERELMGGDCLNVGCVPSKGIISSARVAATIRQAKEFGVDVPGGTQVDFAAVMERMRRLRASISPHDSAKRFSDLGVDVYFGQASFEKDGLITVERSDSCLSELNYKKAVIASGARASAPDIPGLDLVEYLTNETLFSLEELPQRFGIIGSGPIGAEMAQTFANLGSEVTLFERSERILPREDIDAAQIVQEQFARDGVQLVLNSKEMELAPTGGNAIRVTVQQNGPPHETIVDKLLIAVGRAPNTENLNLNRVGVNFDNSGIEVNDSMQTTNPRIFAAGDVCSKYKFTHAADFQARMVIQNALFAIGPFGKKKASNLLIPWATYTSPEVAHVGLYEKDAKQEGVDVDTYRQDFDGLDRAILEGNTSGFVKVMTKKGTDKILGATIVAENAGDLISEITLAMSANIGLSRIGAAIHPYPTQAEAIRKLGDQYSRTKLNPTSKKILGFLRWLNVGS